MRALRRVLAAAPLVAAALVAAGAGPAAAQASRFRDGTAPLTAAALAADGFTPFFSFRLTGLAPGSDGPALLGGVGDCLPGDACQTSTGAASAGAVVPAEGGTYRMGSSWFQRFGGRPHFGVVNPGMTEAHLELPLAGVPAGPIGALYVAIGGGSAGTLRVSDLIFTPLSPDPADPVVDHPVAFDETVGPGGVRFAAFRLLGDLRGGFLLGFTATTEGLAAGGASPTIDVYLGTVTSAPEPATVGMLGAGVVGLAGLGWRRRAR